MHPCFVLPSPSFALPMRLWTSPLPKLVCPISLTIGFAGPERTDPFLTKLSVVSRARPSPAEFCGAQSAHTSRRTRSRPFFRSRRALTTLSAVHAHDTATEEKPFGRISLFLMDFRWAPD
jgi:hypothetical protein